ncbi:MAG: hypothetical protein EBZ48_08670 [Proteobacteria bacterium]|nr:hypothetical protein [Pseudomonadota bacterium]
MFRRIGVQVKPGETEQFTFRGERVRKRTILVSLGSRQISKQALELGAVLIICQILDGVLTYAGLSIMGVQMEGNSLLRELMHVYGMAPTIFIAKTLAIVLAIVLMLHAHSRRWIRPVIALLVVTYLALAVVPWTYIISAEKASREQQNIGAPRAHTTQ